MKVIVLYSKYYYTGGKHRQGCKKCHNRCTFIANTHTQTGLEVSEARMSKEAKCDSAVHSNNDSWFKDASGWAAPTHSGHKPNAIKLRRKQTESKWREKMMMGRKKKYIEGCVLFVVVFLLMQQTKTVFYFTLVYCEMNQNQWPTYSFFKQNGTTTS